MNFSIITRETLFFSFDNHSCIISISAHHSILIMCAYKYRIFFYFSLFLNIVSRQRRNYPLFFFKFDFCMHINKIFNIWSQNLYTWPPFPKNLQINPNRKNIWPTFCLVVPKITKKKKTYNFEILHYFPILEHSHQQF